jgi:hypothetical protein
MHLENFQPVQSAPTAPTAPGWYRAKSGDLWYLAYVDYANHREQVLCAEIAGYKWPLTTFDAWAPVSTGARQFQVRNRFEQRKVYRS